MAEKKAIDWLSEKLGSKVSCCLANNSFNKSFKCGICPTAEEIKQKYENEGLEVLDVQVKIDDSGFLPLRFEHLSDDLVKDFADIRYSLNGYLYNVFAYLQAELDNIGLEEESMALILSNSSLCDQGPALFKSSGTSAIDYYNSNFAVPGKELVIVIYIWLNPDGSGNDKVFKKFLWADDGDLNTSEIELSLIILELKLKNQCYHIH